MIDIEKRKKYVFEHYEKSYGDFRIRLKYDGLKQGEFFRAIVDGYLEKDALIMRFIEEYKLKHKKFGKRKIQKTTAALRVGRESMKSLGLTESERNKIFDIVEGLLPHDLEEE